MINGKTKVCCIIGDPIEHSLSPLVHNTAYKACGLDFIYLPFRVKNIEQAIQGMRGLGIRGMSVTIPHKTAVIKFLDSIDDSAGKIGAVNTIVNESGKLTGYNTDSAAAIKALEENNILKGKRVVLVGSGGAAAAIAFGLKKKDVRLTILNRTVEKAMMLAKKVNAEEYGGLDKLEVIKRNDILINSTAIGMFPKTSESVIPKEFLHEGLTVFDIVYNPKETKLLKDAGTRGSNIIYGYKMLLYQAATQFALFTGCRAPLPEMEQAIIKVLEGNKNA